MKILYHNLTKSIINESEVVDFCFKLDQGDKVYKTQEGNPELIELSEEEVKSLRLEASKHFWP